MPIAIAILSILIVTVTLAILAREFEKLKHKHGNYLSLYLNQDNRKRFVIADVILIVNMIYILAMIAMIKIGFIENSLPELKYYLSASIFIGASAAFYLLYNQFEKFAISLFSHWLGRLLLSAISITTIFLSSSYTLIMIEELTGYSASNFQSIDDIKWFFIVLFILIEIFIAITAVMLVITLKDAISNKKSRKEKNVCELESQFSNLSYPRYLAALLLIGYLTIYIETIFSNNFKANFTSLFVHTNFHALQHECKGVKPGSLSAHLWRNSIDDNNILLAQFLDDQWSFKAIECELNQELKSADS